MTAEPQPLPTLSVEDLRELLRRVLKNDEKMPSRADLTELARQLQVYRWLHLHYVEQLKPQAVSAKKARQAAEYLGDHLRKIRADTIAATTTPLGSLEFVKASLGRDIAAMKSVEVGIKYLLTESIALHPSTTSTAPFEKWKDLAVALSGAFVDALRPNNPTVQFGRSNDGPVPRFVAEIIPYVTGEAPTTTAVGKVLKDLRRPR